MSQSVHPGAVATIGDPARVPPRRRSILRKVLLGALAVLGAVFVAVVLALVGVRTEAGRRFAARRIESVVAARLGGRLSIGSLTSISSDGVRAQGVRFTAPNGDEVIAVDEVDFGVRWLPLLRGRVLSPRATARGGRVLVHDDARGELSIAAMFRGRAAPDRSGTSRRSEGTGSIVELQRIDVYGVTFVSDVRDVPDSRVTGVHGRLAIRVRERDGSVLLTLNDLAGSGRLSTPLATVVRLTSGTLRIDTAETELVRADARGVLDGQSVRIQCNARVTDARTRIGVRLTLPAGAGLLDAFPTIAQATALGLASSSFDFDLVRN